jgi:hypothetical protein
MLIFSFWQDFMSMPMLVTKMNNHDRIFSELQELLARSLVHNQVAVSLYEADYSADVKDLQYVRLLLCVSL